MVEMNILKRARIRYILHRHAIAHDLWVEVTEKLSVLQGMTAVEKARLRELTTLFLHDKRFVGAQGLQLTDAMCLTVATQACLPVLHLGMGCLSGWIDIIVYPSAFLVGRDEGYGGCRPSSGKGTGWRVLVAWTAYIVMGRC